MAEGERASSQYELDLAFSAEMIEGIFAQLLQESLRRKHDILPVPCSLEVATATRQAEGGDYLAEEADRLALVNRMNSQMAERPWITKAPKEADDDKPFL